MAQPPRGDSREIAIGFKSSLANTFVPWEGNPTTKAGFVEIKDNVLVGTPLVGQTKIAITGTAVQLASNALENGVIVTAKSTNTDPISVGTSAVNNTVDGTGNGYILEAGASTSFAVANTDDLYINGTATDIVSFAGS